MAAQIVDVLNIEDVFDAAARNAARIAIALASRGIEFGIPVAVDGLFHSVKWRPAARHYPRGGSPTKKSGAFDEALFDERRAQFVREHGGSGESIGIVHVLQPDKQNARAASEDGPARRDLDG